VSRLLFRFYDVLDGSVLVNGVDVRDIKQKSLRSALGVVPQAARLVLSETQETVLMGMFAFPLISQL